MATKKTTQKPAIKKRRGPIDPKEFMRWLSAHGCYYGVAEAKARMHVYRKHSTPVEAMLAEAIGTSRIHWPGPPAAEGMPYTPSYLRWLARFTTGYRPENWDGIKGALTRENIRKAMKRDGFEG